MKSKSCLILRFYLLGTVWFLPGIVLAQSAPVVQDKSPPLRTASAPRPSYAQTMTGLAAAVAFANGKNDSISCAVIDSAGELVGFTRMDGSESITRDIAEAKARASVTFGQPSGDVEKKMGPVFGKLNQLLGNRMVALGGGLPIVGDKQIIGAIACSGAAGPGNLDEEAARTAIAAMGLSER